MHCNVQTRGSRRGCCGGIGSSSSIIGRQRCGVPLPRGGLLLPPPAPARPGGISSGISACSSSSCRSSSNSGSSLCSSSGRGSLESSSSSSWAATTASALHPQRRRRRRQHRGGGGGGGAAVVAAAGAADPPPSPPPSPPPPPPGSVGFLGSLYKSLRDFGLGKSSMAEGGVGLFTLAGAVVGVALLAWVKGTALRKGRPYTATLEFPLACGITVGTPVRIRGVAVGSVLNVRPSLDKVDVLVEVNDVSTVIPRNSVIEANQSGLIAEPLVDITPQLPLPDYSASPAEVPACEAEGAIVCDGGHIVGQQGVALDDMVYVMTRMARQMEEEGVDKFFEAATAATAALEEATPLLEEAAALAREVTPLLQELREGGLAANLDHLTEAAAGAASDIQSLQKAVLTDDNVRALRSAVLTLCRTLEHVESISADVSVFSRDTGVQRNLKTLITALSRVIEE